MVSTHGPYGLGNFHCYFSITEETSSMQTLEELVAKLEFENELNRVCMTLNTQSLHSARGHSTGSADSGVEEGASEEDGEEDEQEILLDTVLEMEQDYDLYY